MLERFFLDHPRSVGETYWQHLRNAFSFAISLQLATVACAIHALVPALFTATGSSIVRRLHARMVTGRSRPQRSA